jgi:hypothetical protein
MKKYKRKFPLEKKIVKLYDVVKAESANDVVKAESANDVLGGNDNWKWWADGWQYEITYKNDNVGGKKHDQPTKNYKICIAEARRVVELCKQQDRYVPFDPIKYDFNIFNWLIDTIQPHVPSNSKPVEDLRPYQQECLQDLRKLYDGSREGIADYWEHYWDMTD